MTTYSGLYLGSVMGLYSCITDASIVAKALPHSTVVSCKLNSETDTGRQLLQNVSTAGFTQ
jgi:hypothetical protein